MRRVYGEQLGCEVDTLLLIDSNITENKIEQKILSSDIIYVGGGDTVKMLEVWRANNVDIYLKKAYENNIVLSGLSAGSICWFQKGHNDSNLLNNTNGWWDYSEPIGIGLIPAIHCPHYNQKGHEYFDEMIKNEGLPGIAIEDNCAIVFKDNLYKIIKSDLNSREYLLSNHNGMFDKKELYTQDFSPVSRILVDDR